MGTSSFEHPSSPSFCTECGRSFAPEDLARFGSNAVCAECKPRYVQGMREGAVSASGLQYGGFWIRFVALFIDGIILSIALFPLSIALGAFTTVGRTDPTRGLRITAGYIGLSYLFNIAIACTYSTFFVSQKGATPGKMLLGLKVVTASGGPVSIGRAAGRFFASYLSGLILCLGYIMAAFDSEKRALHDHICGTRVIRKR